MPEGAPLAPPVVELDELPPEDEDEELLELEALVAPQPPALLEELLEDELELVELVTPQPPALEELLDADVEDVEF